MQKKTLDKPIASLSLDLDNQWSYMKIHGDAGWDSYPSYFSIFIPHVLEVLDRLGCNITFFIVGKDADIQENVPYLKQITEAGHEVGNHSYHHESWLKKFNKKELEEEIEQTEKAIFTATGQKPLGFRGPGFSWSEDLLEVLTEKGYLYDASTLPTYLGPVARKYYFMTSKLSKEERKERAELFGSFADGLRPVKPYFWQLTNGSRLLEIPVTTIPIIKLPFHFSYLLYLSGYSMRLMHTYLQTAITFCRMTGTSPSYLLHPLDLIGGDLISELRFFPGMDIDSSRKLDVFTSVITTLQEHYRFVPMSEHSQAISKSPQNLPLRPVR
jgi:hypothetical protein